MPVLRAKEKKERALGAKLFLKAERCSSPKCATVRRPQRPGQHGKARRRPLSEFGTQLLEKQRIRVSYGLQEIQLGNIFKEALSRPGNISESIMQMLEARFANAVYRAGLAPSRIVARQVINHGHILVNGKKISSPSYQVRVGDVISVNPGSRESMLFKELPEILKKYETPKWISLDREKFEATIKSMPYDFDVPFDINMVVDYYSK
ncbi:MAG: 30S ribosomal protein S4 [Candidatus Wolfebacteria bacterium]|nr:30S ribosomal protein S4 [Candidatus Wolfebacteria bacterium]